MAVILIKDTIFNKDFFTQLKHFEPSKLHKHEFFEFFYVSAGSCFHHYNGKTSLISTCDAFLMTPDDEHTFYANPKDDSFTHRDILFSIDYFKKLCDILSPTLYTKIMEKKYPSSLSLTIEQINHIEQQSLYIITSRKKTFATLLTMSLGFYILDLLLTQVIHNEKRPTWLISLLSYFSDPVYFNSSIKDITQKFNLNNSYMCRKFKQYTNKTMAEYFNTQKILYARSLLLSTDFSTEKICELSGFMSTSYFYRLYKKIYGQTPRSGTKSIDDIRY